MAGRTFQQRLQACQRGGNLTVSDLARWFGRSAATARSWVKDGRQPSGGLIDVTHAHELLGLLEMLIRKKKGFPVPRLPPSERIEHLAHIRKSVLP
ncbi:MAG: hypothetical protein KGI71_06115 [Patescibacteria group bacterium]|nr:hypothetical protein [Patescibacteria group bacterium]